MALIKTSSEQRGSEERRAGPRDLAGLLSALEDDDPLCRRWAARDLTGQADASEALVRRLHRETDGSVREVIFTALTSLSDEGAVNGLVACLRSEDVPLRTEAIEAMKQMPAAMTSVMPLLLADASPDVRIFAVNILESLRHPLVESWLIAVIAGDPHVNVCATAVDLLGEVGSSTARGPLLRLKERFPDETYIGFAADVALERLSET